SFILTVASAIASQAMITGWFSIFQKSLPIGCFPPVKTVHTSAKHEGQVYIPQANYLLNLMLGCLVLKILRLLAFAY
ncbi:hypothetical protein RCOM_0062010, partial [Ricinus communis]